MSILQSPDDLLIGLTAALPPGAPLRFAPGLDVRPRLIRVQGPDAVDFLQRITTADLAALEVGRATPLAFLDPKGKLLATALAGRGADGVLLAVPAGRFATVLAWCERYHFTEKLTIAEHPVAAAVLNLTVGARGFVRAGAATLEWTDDRAIFRLERGGLAREWAFSSSVDPAAPPEDAHLAARVEALRIGSGDVLVGVDTEDRTLALEAGLNDHISTTKGCYTGQEIVARVFTYGHVNKRLVRLSIEGTDPVAHGSAVVETALGDVVGRVFSSAPIHSADTTLAIGILAEAFLADPAPLRLAEGLPRAVRHADLVPA